MATKLIGYEQRKGNFTNKDTGELVEFDNTKLYYVSNEKPTVKGLYCDEATAKTDELQIINAKNIDEALDKEVYLITDITTKADADGKARLRIAKIVVVGK